MKRKNTLLWIACMFIASAAFAQNIQRSAPLLWEELGPANMGGRTRAILIDHRDASRSTLYAGMVSGGLWKSTDRGNTWHPLLSVHTCAAVTCIAQDANGRIYFGTGEGLAQPSGSSRNSGSVGNGLHFLYGSDQDSILPSTVPAAYVSNSGTWPMINRIAINPTNPGDIYAATSSRGGNTSGLQHSTDGGQNWTVVGSSSAPITGLSTGYNAAADVKFSSDGNFIFASVGLAIGTFPGSNLIVSQDGGSTFSYVSDTSFGANITRIEIAISPSDPAVAYISIAPNWGAGRVLKTADAGNTWTNITAPIVANAFGFGQGWYDNAISVYPQRPDRVYFGGIGLYTYSDLNGWTQASVSTGSHSNPHWVHPDVHTIVFNDLDSNEMYIGCDGGIFRSTNVSSGFPTPTYAERNGGYNTIQMYSVASDLYGNVLGGAEEAGTILIDINHGAQQVLTGTGVYTEISHFDSSVFIGGYVDGEDYRSTDRGNTWNNMFDAAIDPYGHGDPSVCGQTAGSNAPFITALWLAETKSATNSVSRVPFVDHVAHSAGDVVTLRSHIGQTFQEMLTGPLPAGDTVYFTDRLQSRLYFATSCGLWMTPDILNTTNTPRWFRITSGSDDVKALAVSSTGDTIYFGGSGKVTRISGLNSVPFDSFPAGQDSIVMTRYPQYQQVSTPVVNSGRYIEGIDADIHDPNHVLCAVADFSTPGTPHVYASRDAGATWTPVGSGLPNMPVYQCVIDAYDPAHYIIGSELGFWDSHDAGATWTEQNSGITVREPVYRLRQQTYLSDQCYALYASTHGRGMWRCTTITGAQGGCTVIPLGISEPADGQYTDRMLLYPNPMDGSGKVMIELVQPSDMTLRVIDMTGRILQEASYSHLNEGRNILDLHTSSLANGSYLVIARLANGQSYNRTLVIAR